MNRRNYFATVAATMLCGLCMLLTACGDKEEIVRENNDPTKDPLFLANGVYLETEEYDFAYRALVQVGKSITMHADKKNGTYTPSFNWESSDESIATVNNKGEVTGVSEGWVYIKASDYWGNYGRCLLKVEPVSKVYDLKIVGFPVTDFNRDHLSELPGVESGTITIGKDIDMITLNNCVINLTDSMNVIESDLSFLQINYYGDCMLKTNGSFVITHSGNFNLEGPNSDATLNIVGDWDYTTAIDLAVATNALIKNANVNITTGHTGLQGHNAFKTKLSYYSDCRLTIEASNVTITTTKPAIGDEYFDTWRGCVSDFEEINLQKSRFDSPNAVVGYPKNHHFIGRCVLDKTTGERYIGTLRIVENIIAQ